MLKATEILASDWLRRFPLAPSQESITLQFVPMCTLYHNYNVMYSCQTRVPFREDFLSHTRQNIRNTVSRHVGVLAVKKIWTMTKPVVRCCVIENRANNMDSIKDVDSEVGCTCMCNCVNVQNIVISIGTNMYQV